MFVNKKNVVEKEMLGENEESCQSDEMAFLWQKGCDQVHSRLALG